MMKFGMIGLGKMGMNLVKNAVDHEIEVVAYDLNTKAVEEAKDYSCLLYTSPSPRDS